MPLTVRLIWIVKLFWQTDMPAVDGKIVRFRYPCYAMIEFMFLWFYEFSIIELLESTATQKYGLWFRTLHQQWPQQYPGLYFGALKWCKICWADTWVLFLSYRHGFASYRVQKQNRLNARPLLKLSDIIISAGASWRNSCVTRWLPSAGLY